MHLLTPSIPCEADINILDQPQIIYYHRNVDILIHFVFVQLAIWRGRRWFGGARTVFN